ncbi:hypothetical protein JHK82_055249 [Glycine max]|uniref:Putative disease resistance protein n=1 Tax=Glycine soja TaxID=3848 RepID=A0A0B2QVV7_GLYSO|nr:hypothetical protein GLYMA_20G041333v4 [Glycine max]KHN23933.1 Putative disease resistance protein [Glycine soja]KAG4906603.1 hypothetical protein JHK86_055087 [Glycine max]KAG4917776.1 hypothetical protein JHK85_056057 [Glycine max]KAG5073878.1 hypothetical protein JHK84_055109 [Glycine max]
MKSSSDKVHKLKPLTQEESMQLFCKKHSDTTIMDIVQKILRKFLLTLLKNVRVYHWQLWLLIVFLSGKENTPFEWEKIRRSLSSEVNKNPNLIGITKILCFSYDDLPCYLKSCLLYFVVYPEDDEVNSD